MKRVYYLWVCTITGIMIYIFEYKFYDEEYQEYIWNGSSTKYKLFTIPVSLGYDSAPRLTNHSTLQEIHDIIWKEIYLLQEEGDCESKKIFLCDTGTSGLGAKLHIYGACLQIAHGLGRILFTKQGQYEHFGGLSHWLMPESIKCGYLKKKCIFYKSICDVQDQSCYLDNGYDINNSYKVLVYNIRVKAPIPRFVPTTVPQSIEQALISNNITEPWLWFTSQFLGYLIMRPNANFTRLLNAISYNINFQYPIAAMHIRHGDKLKSEAQYIKESQFIEAADKFFNKNLRNEAIRRIYVASDDINIQNKLEPHLTSNYKILILPARYRKQSLNSYRKGSFRKEVIESILIDIYFLVYSNYTICTFSSNICRLIYELKLAISPYMSQNNVISMDEGFYYIWFGYSNGMMQNTWISFRENALTKVINGYKILQYNKGQLFILNKRRNVTLKGNKFTALFYVDTVYRKGNQEKGFIYADDVIKWPGNPKYYMYQ